MNIRTLEQLDSFLSKEMAWRKKELTVIRFLIKGARDDRRSALLRAAVTLLYAHWEGFVRAAGRGYLDYVSRQGLRYRELSTPFLAIGARRRLKEASTATSIGRHIDLAEFFVTGLGSKSSLSPTAINTRSNLSSRVLKEIVATLGLDFSDFLTKETLIDKSLVDRRNSIAHGEYVSIDADDYQRLSSDVLALMERFRDQVDNAAALRSFRRV